MQDIQNIPNPDVNSTEMDDDFGSHEGLQPDGRKGDDDIEKGSNEDMTPVPPNAAPAYPMEEPPRRDGSPTGDVDDSPKQITGEE